MIQAFEKQSTLYMESYRIEVKQMEATTGQTSNKMEDGTVLMMSMLMKKE